MSRALLLRQFSPSLYRRYANRRARQVEQQIAEESAYYEALSQGASPIPVQTRLRERLAARGLTVTPKPRGALHSFYATGPSNWEVHNIPPQLELFGKLTRYFYREQGYDDTSAHWLRQRDEMNAQLLACVREAHHRQPIDLFFSYLSGWHVAPEVIRELGSMGIVTCGFNLDDKPSFRGGLAGGRWRGPAAVASAYDLNLTNAPSSIVKYEVEGGLAMFWPEAANPQHFRPLEREWKFDVSFIGGCYGYRPILIDNLLAQGVSVETFGPGWPNGPITEQEMVEIYATSRINLGFGGVGYSRVAQCLKGRDFEVPMAGGLYLTSDNAELGLVYRVGEDIDVYRDDAECLQKIRRYLDDPQAASRLRQAGRQTCLARHTWAHRFAELFTTVGLLA